MRMDGAMKAPKQSGIVEAVCKGALMIVVDQLTKQFGKQTAVDHISFTAQDGKVTGFVGPNGAGKSTTMKIILGLIHPDSGTALIDGKPYNKQRAPLTAVGAVLDARSAHKGMSARNYLSAIAETHHIGKERVQEVMRITGITEVASRKAGSFSLGMSQRLSLAAALLGDPKNVILDEPVNGLDPEGVRWVRDICKYLASEGRAVLLSSHLMAEVALTADDVVIIGRGKILRQQSVQSFVDEHSQHTIRITTPDMARLTAVLATLPQVHVEVLPMSNSSGFNASRVSAGEANSAGFNSGGVVHTLRIHGANIAQIGQIIAQHRIVIYELIEEKVSLEDAFMALTHQDVQYQSTLPAQSTLPMQQPVLPTQHPTSAQQPTLPTQESLPMQGDAR